MEIKKIKQNQIEMMQKIEEQEQTDNAAEPLEPSSNLQEFLAQEETIENSKEKRRALVSYLVYFFFDSFLILYSIWL